MEFIYSVIKELYEKYPEFGDMPVRKVYELVEEFSEDKRSLLKSEFKDAFEEFIKEKISWFNGGTS